MPIFTVEEYSQYVDYKKNIIDRMNDVHEIVKNIRRIRNENKINKNTKLNLHIKTKDKNKYLPYFYIIKKLAILDKIIFVD